MPTIYVDDELHEKLKEKAKSEGRPIVSVLRRFAGLEGANVNGAGGAVAATDADTGPEGAWEKVKIKLEEQCGCVFDDAMNVLSVTNPDLFKTISNGKLRDKFLEAHPEVKDI